MNIDLEKAIAELTASLHSGKIDPHGEKLESELRTAIKKHEIQCSATPLVPKITVLHLQCPSCGELNLGHPICDCGFNYQTRQ